MFPFEVDFEEVERNPSPFISKIIQSLASEFLEMPKGNGFIDYSTFEIGYERLKLATRGFTNIEPEAVLEATKDEPICLIVLRTILGFTPPEWAYVATQRMGVEVSQSTARTLDRSIRIAPEKALKTSGVTLERLTALIQTACLILNEGAPALPPDRIHRLDKVDTREPNPALQNLASMGVPYAVLLYERFLGRPFAGHRDSVSDLIGDNLESVIEDLLVRSGISYRKTRRAERIPGFDQAPDFMIPSEFNPQVIIEAKMTEDDGTARDKVTRIQHLGALSVQGQTNGVPKYQVVACIAGRGFGVRRNDMMKMLLATRGKVFTLKTLPRLVECTCLKEFATKQAG